MARHSSIQPLTDTQGDREALRRELDRARGALADAEALLAGEQASVNAFRMHCRLKLDNLVDQLMELRSAKEALLVNLEFLLQGIDPAYLAEDDLLSAEEWSEETAADVDPLLPTDTPLDKAAEKRLYRELARRFHPDLAATAFERSYRTTIMSAVNRAYSEGNTDALYDLAGELSPKEAASLAGIPDREQRKIRGSINKMRRLEAKAVRQLAALRQENTARLWRRAQYLGEDDEDEWSLIRRELQAAIDRREKEILKLREQLHELDAQRRDRQP